MMLMKQTNSKTFLLSQDMRESNKAVEFKHMAYTISEKALTFFITHEMQKLKSVLLDQLLETYKFECRRVDAASTYNQILDCVTKSVLKVSPHMKLDRESIFEEEPDLVALLL